MNKKYIQSLIQLVEESKIESLEVSSWGRKVRITQKLDAESNGHGTAHTLIAAPVPAVDAQLPQRIKKRLNRPAGKRRPPPQDARPLHEGADRGHKSEGRP